jgi:mannose-6-phosphate isomerase
MNELYPLKFAPQFYNKPWGGNNISKIKSLKAAPAEQCGEAWLLSGVEGHVSVVENGFLKGNELNELIEVYMEDLVGENVFEKYGSVFPILIKILDTTDWLSVQVHPDNKLALKNHNVPFGKTEMWYIVNSGKDSGLINGLKKPSNAAKIKEAIENGSIAQELNMIKPAEQDVFFTPAGKIHAVGPGLTLAEIQQTSDFTYRLFDWNRKDKNGKARELHIEAGLEAINYEDDTTGKTEPVAIDENIYKLVSCPEFVTNKITLKASEILNREYYTFDSFIILLCVSGDAEYEWNNKKESLNMGECVLVPAMCDDITLKSKSGADILEVYIQG